MSIKAQATFNQMFAGKPRATLYLNWVPQSFVSDTLRGTIVNGDESGARIATIFGENELKVLFIPHHNIFMVDYDTDQLLEDMGIDEGIFS